MRTEEKNDEFVAKVLNDLKKEEVKPPLDTDADADSMKLEGVVTSAMAERESYLTSLEHYFKLRSDLIAYMVGTEVEKLEH